MLEGIHIKKLWGFLGAILFAFSHVWITVTEPKLLITFSTPIMITIVASYFGKQAIENIKKTK